MSGKTKDLLKQAKANENESSISSAEKNFSDAAEAAQTFSLLRSKLLDIEEWNKHSLLSDYQLFDETGKPHQANQLSVGVFIRISLTGSGKYDWIKVEDIFEAADEFIITVKPTYDPTAEIPDKRAISHFFTDDSTNNFCLLKTSNTIYFYVIGLNEKQNLSETENVLQTIRNFAVNLGTYLGIQKGEWEKFCHHFLEDAAEEIKPTDSPE